MRFMVERLLADLMERTFPPKLMEWQKRDLLKCKQVIERKVFNERVVLEADTAYIGCAFMAGFTGHGTARVWNSLIVGN